MAGVLKRWDGAQWVPVNGIANEAYFAQFAYEGTLVVKTGKGHFYFPVAATILGVSAIVDTAPTGADVILDVNKNGTTVFTTQGNRPTIPAGSTETSAEAVPNTTAVAAGDDLTVDIDQIGSTVAGADLSVVVRYRVP